MTFEEDFPSILWDVLGPGNIKGYTREQIMKNCLDKQRVREAIKKAVHYEINGTNNWLSTLQEELDFLYEDTK